MKFRPCIDIHNGQVKQIVGGSLDDDKGASENFVSILDGSYYGELYKKYGLKGGHIILLNKYGTPEYDSDYTTTYTTTDGGYSSIDFAFDDEGKLDSIYFYNGIQ